MGKSEDRECKTALYSRIAVGDRGAADELLVLMSGLVKSQARRFVRDRPGIRRLFDDLVGDATLAITEETYSLVGREKDIRDISAYLLKVMDRSFCTTIAEDPVFGPSRSTISNRNREASESTDESAGLSIPQRETVELDELLESDGDRMSDVCEAIASCCTTELEVSYVELQLNNAPEFLTNDDAAERLGVSASTVSRARQAIKSRYAEESFATGV